MVESEVRAKYFREAEDSFRLEGLDPSGDEFYQATKARVIAGEIDADEMMRLVVENSKLKFKRNAAELAIAG